MSEIDPELDATWRAASREQPPAALDDAIRAAARREVGAKPGGFRAAPRWWPLAAAATVAAIAVGIVQMTPPEQVTPAAITSANDTSSNVAQRDVKPDTDRPNANQPQRQGPSLVAAAQALRDASKPTAKERSGALDENARSEPGRRRSDSLAAASSAQVQEKKALEAPQQAPPQRVEELPERDQDLKQKTEQAAAPLAARPDSAVSPSRASSVARNARQPFPAAPAPVESDGRSVPLPMAGAPSAPAGVTSPASAPAMTGGKLAAQSSATGALSGTIAGTGNAEPAPAKDATALEKRAAAMADKVTAERREERSPLASDEWIKRIRRLIAEGKNEDAAKELVAFRREYKERSDALLPNDLRAFRQ